MLKTYLLFLLIISISFFSKAQQTVNKNDLNPKQIIINARNNISKNYDFKNFQFELNEKTETNNEISKFDIDFKKANFINKDSLKGLQKKIDLQLSRRQNQDLSNICKVSSLIIYNQDSIKTKILHQKGEIINNSTHNHIQNSIETILYSLDTTNTYTVKTGLFKVEDSLNINRDTDSNIATENYRAYIKEVISKIDFKSNLLDFSFIHFIDKYDYKLEEIKKSNNNYIYNISFSPRSNLVKYKGNLFIKSTDYAILKINYELIEKKKGKGLNMKFLMGLKQKNLEFKKQVLFRKFTNGIYIPAYIKEEKKNYIFADRNFKIKSNKTNDYLKFKILVEVVESQHQEFQFSNIGISN